METWYSLPGFFDPMSSISHLAGAVLYLELSIFLLASAWGCHKRFWLSLIFCLSAIALLSLSGVHHMLRLGGTPRAVLLRLDVAAIFVLIAGTFSPIHGVLFKGWRRWSILVPLWTVAVAGITLRTIFFESVPQWLGTSIFLAMGWIGGVSAVLLWKSFRWEMWPILAGGVVYSIGGLMTVFDWPVVVPCVWGPHETFHLLVLLALGLHWKFIARIADGTLRYQPKNEFLVTAA